MQLEIEKLTLFIQQNGHRQKRHSTQLC